MSNDASPFRLATPPFGSANSPLVIPTGAYLDFLLRAASDVRMCSSP
jgi:hypothetical protein